MTDIIRQLEAEQAAKILEKRTFPDLSPGDTVRVHYRIREGEKERIQVFEGMVIRIRRAQNRSTFTVRKVSYNVGVERVFPLHSPTVTGVEVVQSRRVRRSKLYFVRKLSGKAALLKEPRYYPRLAQHHTHGATHAAPSDD